MLEVLEKSENPLIAFAICRPNLALEPAQARLIHAKGNGLPDDAIYLE